MASSVELFGEDVELIVFSVGGINCGLPISEVKEIIKTASMTSANAAAAHVTGVINLRGSIVTIIDLRTLLGLESSDTSGAVYILMVKFRGELIGLLVDRIEDSLHASHKDFFPAPSNLNRGERELFNFAYKREDDLVAILDLDGCLLDSAS